MTNNDNFLQKQLFEDGCNGNIAVINSFDDSDLIKENYMMRTNGDNGMSKLGNMRKVCQIPQFLFDKDEALKEYQLYCNSDPNYARKILRRWLQEHPEYKCSNGGI